MKIRELPQVTRILAASIGVMLTTHTGWAASGLEERFRSEYPAAAKRLEAMVAEIRAKAEIQRDNETPELFEFRKSGESRLSIRDIPLARAGDRSRIVLCRTPDSFFQLKRGPGAKAYELSMLGIPPNISERQELMVSAFMDRYLQATYCVQQVPFLKLMNHPSFRPREVRGVARETGSQLVKVTFTCDDPTHFVGGGEVTFDPDLDWALSSFEVDVRYLFAQAGKKAPPGMKSRGEFQQRRLSDRLIFPESGRFEFLYPGGKSEGVDSFRFTSVEAVPTPAADFRRTR